VYVISNTFREKLPPRSIGATARPPRLEKESTSLQPRLPATPTPITRILYFYYQKPI